MSARGYPGPVAGLLMLAVLACSIGALAIARSNNTESRTKRTTSAPSTSVPSSTPTASQTSTPALPVGEGAIDRPGPEPLPEIPQTRRERDRLRRTQDPPGGQWDRGARAQARRWPALARIPWSDGTVTIEHIGTDPARPRVLLLLVLSDAPKQQARAAYYRFLDAGNDDGRNYRVAFLSTDRRPRR